MTDEDDEFARIQREAAMGMRPHPPLNPYRNTVLEEVAKEFDKMTSLGDTAASFAVFVRRMKQ
jgi:hypothetical protein